MTWLRDSNTHLNKSEQDNSKSDQERVVIFTDHIPWADINNEYKWFARNENGDRFIYKNKPRIENRCYWVAPYPPCYLEQGIDANIFAGFAKGTIDWKDSLQERK